MRRHRTPPVTLPCGTPCRCPACRLARRIGSEGEPLSWWLRAMLGALAGTALGLLAWALLLMWVMR